MQKCLETAFFLTASRGRLLQFVKNILIAASMIRLLPSDRVGYTSNSSYLTNAELEASFTYGTFRYYTTLTLSKSHRWGWSKQRWYMWESILWLVHCSCHNLCQRSQWEGRVDPYTDTVRGENKVRLKTHYYKKEDTQGLSSLKQTLRPVE